MAPLEPLLESTDDLCRDFAGAEVDPNDDAVDELKTVFRAEVAVEGRSEGEAIIEMVFARVADRAAEREIVWLPELPIILKVTFLADMRP